MASLQVLPNELFYHVLDEIKPHDLVNFSLSCKVLYSMAARRLAEHKVMRKTYKRIENNRGPFSECQFSELLHHILINSHKAEYVEQISIENWYLRFFRPGEDTENMDVEEYDEYYSPYPYSESKMKAFENAVKKSESIPSEAKEHWISRLNDGDENPVLALLLPRLHYLTSLKIAIKDMEDEFLIPTVKRLVKEPRSSSLSRLLEVEIEGTIGFSHPLYLLAFFAALPSVTSLKGCELIDDSRTLDEVEFPLAEGSSKVENLFLDGCTVSCPALFNLVRCTKPLRSFTYSQLDYSSSLNSDDADFSIEWVCAAFQYASTSLQDLALRRSHFLPSSRDACSFKCYRNLRVLSIDFALLMGDQYYATTKIDTLLPRSLEMLNLYGYRVESLESLIQFVKFVVRVKARLLPCLEELNFLDTSSKRRYTSSQIEEVCAMTGRAGFVMTLTEDTYRRPEERCWGPVIGD